MTTVERFSDAATFLAAAEPFLLRSEIENSVILGIANGLVSGFVTAKVSPYFGLVRDGDTIAMAAFMSMPGRLGVTRSRSADAIDALARDIHGHGPPVETAVGPEPTAGEFAAALATFRGDRARATRAMAQRIHELRRVEYGGTAPGRLRQAKADDAALLTPWAADFFTAMGHPADAAERVREMIKHAQLFVWDNDGPVSMAAWQAQTPHGVRVAYVYTPPELRGRGYATCCVARLSRLLLERDNDFVCLYTDLANPTSNAIYARIGYRGVSDAALWTIK